MVIVIAAYFIAPIVKSPDEPLLDTGPTAVQPRMVAAIIGIVLVLGAAYATRETLDWNVGSREVVLMVVGALVHGVFVWMFNGQTFNLPSVSQVTLRPAAVFPAFFGFMFGPAVGFMAGAAGNIVGDLFVGTVSPHWSVANGLIGLIAGMAKAILDEKRSLNVATAIAGIGGIVAAAFFLAAPATQLSFLMGLSVLIGAGLAIALRFAFPNRQEWALATLWGSAGVIVGPGLASIADIWVNGSTLSEAVVGEFIPAAGPSLIALAILLPILMVIYDSVQEPTDK
ncbi:MAG: ECF transporter S component [Chloroflexota bacterium]